MKRWRAMLAIVGVLTLIAGAYGWRTHRIEATECAAVKQLDERLPSDPARTVVVGDSYAAGWGLDSYDEAWPALLERKVRVRAASGAGWSRGGLCNRPALAVLADGERADLVVLQGGLNDTFTSPEAARNALGAVSVDASQIVVVGPPRTPGFVGEEDVDAALRAAADALGAQYVSLLGVDVAIEADGMHPTPAGHKVIAGEVRVAIN